MPPLSIVHLLNREGGRAGLWYSQPCGANMRGQVRWGGALELQSREGPDRVQG